MRQPREGSFGLELRLSVAYRPSRKPQSRHLTLWMPLGREGNPYQTVLSAHDEIASHMYSITETHHVALPSH